MECKYSVKMTKKQKEELGKVSECIGCGAKFSQKKDTNWMLMGDFHMEGSVIRPYGLCPKCGPKYNKGAVSLMKRIRKGVK